MPRSSPVHPTTGDGSAPAVVYCIRAPEFKLTFVSCVLFCKFGDFGGAVGNDYRTAVSWIGVVHA